MGTRRTWLTFTVAVLALLVSASSSPGATAAPRPARPFDFDGDGYADLAVGVPYEDDHAIPDSGAVNVLYGSAAGLSAKGDQLWSQNSRGVPDRAETGDGFGMVASGDFDGDGYADLAVGAPGETVRGHSAAGSVTVLYGTRDGLRSRRSRSFTQATRGVPGNPQARGLFGASVAAGDFDGDHRWDLAIGAPGVDVGPEKNDRGSVTVLLGGAKGLGTRGAQLWDDGPLGPASGLGQALATGDLGGDGHADLVVLAGDGSIVTLQGGRRGLRGGASARWDADTSGLARVMTARNEFTTIALGDFNGDHRLDLAAGAERAVRDENDDNCEEDGWCEGAVVLLPGQPWGGFGTEGSKILTWGSDGLPGYFIGMGRSLAAGDLDGDGRAELAVGAGGSDFGTDVIVMSFAGGAALQPRSFTTWYDSPPGGEGNDQSDVTYGDTLQIAQLGRSSHADLVVGVSDDTVAGRPYAGRVAVLYGSSAGLTRAGQQSWSQDSPGVRGSAEEGDRFGVLAH